MGRRRAAWGPYVPLALLLAAAAGLLAAAALRRTAETPVLICAACHA